MDTVSHGRCRKFGTQLEYGLNADEAEEVNSGLIRKTEDGFKSVNYNGVLAILLCGLKNSR